MLVHAPDSGIAVDQLAMIGAVQRSSELIAALKELTDRQAELRALRFRYADTHPPVRRLAAQLDTLARRVIPGLGRALIAGLAARERELRQRADSITGRSEERRVGKECRSRWSPNHYKKKKNISV